MAQEFIEYVESTEISNRLSHMFQMMYEMDEKPIDPLE